MINIYNINYIVIWYNRKKFCTTIWNCIYFKRLHIHTHNIFPRFNILYSFNGESNTVSKKPVQIVDIQPSGYIINAELELGERYVAAGAAFISDGQQVRVLGETR